MNIKTKLAIALILCVAATPVTQAFADTKAQKQKDDAAQAEAKSEAQAAKGHTLRASRQAKKAEDASQKANQQQAKSAAKVGRSRKCK